MKKYQWKNYEPADAATVDAWLDDKAVRETGLDEGWDAYHRYWTEEDAETTLGENYWCKIAFLSGVPLGAVAFFLSTEGTLHVGELLVDPAQRGKGHGTAMLRELLTEGGPLAGRRILRAEAVIFPDNRPSQRAFEKAGFRFSHAHPDGDAWYYVYP